MGASPSQGVQGERVSGSLAGLMEAAAAPRGIIFETGIDREIASQSLCLQVLCITLPRWLATGPVRLHEQGEVVERLMALGCKPSVLRDYGGSNPPLSTMSFGSGRE